MEEDLFLKKMKGVKPIKKKDNIIKKKHKTNTHKLKNGSNINEPNLKQTNSKTYNKKSEFKISFSEINKDLKKGRVRIDKKIDLHGFSLLDAEDIVKNTIINCYKKNMRCILFVTGKGVHKVLQKHNNETQAPKLYYGKIKNSIISWVNNDDVKKYILTYQDAGIEHGGDGAIFIYLRKNKI